MAKFKLPKRLKAKWIKALLSGEYPQGEGALYENGKYCCLGVLGSICGISDFTMTNKGWLDSVGRSDLLGPMLGPNGIIAGNPQSRLSYLNDNGKSFKYIAAYIKRYL